MFYPLPARPMAALLVLTLALVGLAPAQAAAAPAQQQSSPCGEIYVVTSGDTLFNIARRCGTTVESILRANPEITDPNRIWPGQRLRLLVATAQDVSVTPQSGLPGAAVVIRATGFPAGIQVWIGAGPAGAQAAVLDQATVPDDGVLVRQVIVPVDAAPAEDLIFAVWTVTGDGDTLWAFSRPFDVIGSGDGIPATYMVEPGDTLFRIAQSFGTTVEAIMALNPEIVDPNVIHVGQVLRISGSVQPIVALTPPSGPPGSTVQVYAVGFPANTDVLISVARNGAAPAQRLQARTDAQGSLLAQVAIPADTNPGVTWNISVMTLDGRGSDLINQFLVTEPVP